MASWRGFTRTAARKPKRPSRTRTNISIRKKGITCSSRPARQADRFGQAFPAGGIQAGVAVGFCDGTRNPN